MIDRGEEPVELSLVINGNQEAFPNAGAVFDKVAIVPLREIPLTSNSNRPIAKRSAGRPHERFRDVLPRRFREGPPQAR